MFEMLVKNKFLKIQEKNIIGIQDLQLYLDAYGGKWWIQILNWDPHRTKLNPVIQQYSGWENNTSVLERGVPYPGIFIFAISIYIVALALSRLNIQTA